MNEKTIRALVEAGAVKKVMLIADGATIHVDIMTQAGVVTAYSGRTWTLILAHREHPYWLMVNTDSGGNVNTFSVFPESPFTINQNLFYALFIHC